MYALANAAKCTLSNCLVVTHAYGVDAEATQPAQQAWGTPQDRVYDKRCCYSLPQTLQHCQLAGKAPTLKLAGLPTDFPQPAAC